MPPARFKPSRKNIIVVDSSDESDTEEYEQLGKIPAQLKPRCENECTSPNQFGVRYLYKDNIPLELKPHQIQSVNWMLERECKIEKGIRGGILALDMGLGKTISTLTVIMKDYFSSSPPEYPTLVSCPLSTIYTWKEQIELFFGKNCPYLVITSDLKNVIDNLTIEKMKQYMIVIINYDALRTIAKNNNIYEGLINRDQMGKITGIVNRKKPSEGDMKKIGSSVLFNTPYTRIVMDESHNFNNPKTALFNTVMSLWSERKWCLSGTPLRNKVGDLLTQFRFLGYDDPVEVKKFNIHYYNTFQLNRFILHMSKEEANINLPTKTTIDIVIDLEHNEREMYAYFMRMAKKAYERHLIGYINFSNVLTVLLRLRQCCIAANTVLKNNDADSYPDTINDPIAADLSEWLSDINGTAGIKSSKILKCMDIIANHVPSREKVIVFTSFKRVIDMLELAIETFHPEFDYEVITGDITGSKRDGALTRFKTDPNKKILFVSLKVGSESLNLTEAPYVIQMETNWVPSVIEQANARSHRIGQEKPVTIWNLIANNTIEQKMLQICKNKTDMFNTFIANKKTKDSGLTASMVGMLLR